MIGKFLERAKERDPILEQDLPELFASDARDNSIATLVTQPGKYRAVANDETRPFREYMVNESVQQYKDYYESDEEESSFFEYLDNFTNRDQIRFMELFEDYSVDKLDHKLFMTIAKREYNPELSVFSNMVLDLVDFKDRVRPLSNDIALMEQANKYQKQNVQQMLDERANFEEMIKEVRSDESYDRLEQASDGYSSIEIAEPKVEQQVPEVEETFAEEIEDTQEAEEIEEPKEKWSKVEHDKFNIFI